MIPFVTPNCSKTTDIYCPYVWFWLHNAAFSSLLLSPLLPRFLSSPNPIRYGWRTRGIRASDLQAPSLNCLVVHPLGPPKIQNLESKIQNSPIQNPKSKLFRPDFGDFGFRILDFGSLCSNSLCEAPNSPNFGFWRGILDFGFWILDFGFWILDFGFWILERYVAFLFVQILDFGFWILDFGFWISDFGFRILDFGFWILDFEPNFGCYIIYICCARRPGSADFCILRTN